MGMLTDTESVTERRLARFAWLRVGALSCCIAAATVAVTSCAHGTAAQPGLGPGGQTAAAQAAPVGQAGDPGSRARSDRVRMLAVRDQFTACEQRIERGPGRVPTVAIVGASYTAGVGPGRAGLSWAADLARKLRWDAVIYGVPGAGYVRAGTDGLGPMTRLLAR